MTVSAEAVRARKRSIVCCGEWPGTLRRERRLGEPSELADGRMLLADRPGRTPVPVIASRAARHPATHPARRWLLVDALRTGLLFRVLMNTSLVLAARNRFDSAASDWWCLYKRISIGLRARADGWHRSGIRMIRIHSADGAASRLRPPCHAKRIFTGFSC